MKSLPRSSFALVLVAAMLAPSFAATFPPGTVLSPRQEMIRNNFAEPNSLDPAIVGGANAGNIVLDLFEPLVALDHHAQPVPGAAESWRQTDPTTWVFNLRKSALWSNGEPVTAQDFVYAWRRLMDPKTGATLAVGNGAYVLKDWQVNSKVIVEKNAKYWDASNVQLTKVTYLVVEDGNADLKLYQSGEEDMMSRLPAGTFGALKTQYPKELHFSRLLGLRYHALNNNDPLLQYAQSRLVKPWIGGYEDSNDQGAYRSKDSYVIKH